MSRENSVRQRSAKGASGTHLEHAFPAHAVLVAVLERASQLQTVEAVDEVEAAFPRLQAALVDALDEVRLLVDKRLARLALFRSGWDGYFHRFVIFVVALVLGDHLEPGVEQVAAQERRGRLAWAREVHGDGV